MVVLMNLFIICDEVINSEKQPVTPEKPRYISTVFGLHPMRYKRQGTGCLYCSTAKHTRDRSKNSQILIKVFPEPYGDKIQSSL